MSTDDYELDERIDDVSNATGSGDHLVTVAVPPERSLGAAREEIEEEHASAEYIDADEASAHATDALERTRRLLHEYEATPEHGLVIYVGVVDGEEVEYAFDDLPSPVSESRIARSNEFDVEPLEAAADASDDYGLLVVERGGAALGRLDGERIETASTLDSDVAGKTRAGGQSAQRFERERERQKESFFEEVAEEAERAFLDAADAGAAAADRTESDGADEDGGAAGADGDDPSEADEKRDADARALSVDGLVVGGTTVTVDEFLDGGYLDHRLRDAVVDDAFSVEYGSEQGLRQLVEKAEDALEGAERERTSEALDEFFDAVGDDDGVVYGRERTEEALSYDAVDLALISEDLPTETVRDLEERAGDQGGEVVVVSTDLERGERFDRAFGGVGALLRFPIE